MTHEASLYDRNCFLTLTLADDHLPEDLSLDVRTFQLFMKKLRKRFPKNRIRFFHCGEYGERFGRPHYHAILFNFDFDDKVFAKTSERGDRLYTSKTLDEIWGLGNCWIGAVTFESTAYVARYVTKKVTGARAPEHYQGRKPEYTTMSRRPGIGAAWIQKFKTDVYPWDEVSIRGRHVKPPRFYDATLSETELARLKAKREIEAAKRPDYENSLYRLRIKERVKMAQIRGLTRKLDKEL